MASYLDIPDAALLTLVARRDREALGELFRRYITVVLVAAGWTEETLTDAEQTAVEVFVDVWKRPETYAPGAASTRSHLIRAALRDATEQQVRLAAARLANLQGWTYHDVADVLVQPSQQVAALIRDQLAMLQGDVRD